MFEALKNLFSELFAPEPEEIRMHAQPIEMNPSEAKVLTRKEARLARLLTVTNPTQEMLAEIDTLRGEI